jgi:hypothetical protein
MHDNQGSIAWAEGGLRKVKHVELKYHYSQYLISTGQIEISFKVKKLYIKEFEDVFPTDQPGLL